MSDQPITKPFPRERFVVLWTHGKQCESVGYMSQEIRRVHDRCCTETTDFPDMASAKLGLITLLGRTDVCSASIVMGVPDNTIHSRPRGSEP